MRIAFLQCSAMSCSSRTTIFRLRIVFHAWNPSGALSISTWGPFVYTWIVPGSQTYSASGSLFYARTVSGAPKYSTWGSFFTESKMNCSRHTTYFHLRVVFLNMNCSWRNTNSIWGSLFLESTLWIVPGAQSLNLKNMIHFSIAFYWVKDDLFLKFWISGTPRISWNPL